MADCRLSIKLDLISTSNGNTEFSSRLHLASPKAVPDLIEERGKHTHHYDFTPRRYFRPTGIFFYPHGQKIIPLAINQLLTSPLSLAVWFMDDGGRGARTPKGLIISVAGYSLKDRTLLKRCLESNFRFKVNLHKNGQMYIPAASYETFHRLVASYVIPLMKYKIPITP